MDIRVNAMHILVCSNNRLTVDAVSLAFQSRQARLTVCESSLEVLAAVEIMDANLLVLDMETPGLNGLLIISAIRELSPSLPILAVSAKSEEDARSFSYKGVSIARLPSGAGAGAQALVAMLTQMGEMSGIGHQALFEGR
jgi:CheY-like chemotaxis protein